MANATAMSRVLDIVEEAARRDRVILVSSAISGCTDKLIAIGKSEDPEQMLDALQQQHLDIIQRLFTGEERREARGECRDIFSEIRRLPRCIESFGEVLSTKILARKLSSEGFLARWIDSREIIRTRDGAVDTATSYANIKKVIDEIPNTRIFVAPGFIASDEQGRVCTLGRGGSDYSAALYAAASEASDVQIWTDVPGIMTTNPKTVPAARSISNISYKAAFDMARYGAKVLYAPTVVPAREKGIPINIRNTFDPAHPGTVISSVASDVADWKGVANQDFGETSVLCLVGEGNINPESAARRIRTALRDAGLTALSEVRDEEGQNFFVDVRKNVVKQAISAIHREFFEERVLSTLNVYIAGKGKISRMLKDMISSKSGRFPAASKQIRIAGTSDDCSVVDEILANPVRRSIFVDCTGDAEIYRQYVPLLNAGINIVSSNRRALSVPYVEYSAMKQAALRNGCFLRYHTTIGSALPVLEYISGEANCNDELESIQAVVSCALNHIITGYDGANTESFATLLRHAQDAGLTELDPRMDLAGKDALRKLLILAREANIPLEAEDVAVTPMLPEEFFSCSLDEFYSKLEASEPAFIRREAELDEIDKRQRFVASVRRDPSAPHGWRAEIKMQLFGVDSQFYWISGTQNVVEIRSRYSDPLIIKGAGEGARQAAAGVLNDILL